LFTYHGAEESLDLVGSRVEELLVLEMPRERVVARLTSAGDLLAGDAKRRALAERVRVTLEKEGVSVRELRELLSECVRNDPDDEYSEFVASQQRKNLWMITISLLVVVLVASLFGRPELLLFGAFGATLGRLYRFMQKFPAKHDAAFSWTTLMMAPVAGALTGWVASLFWDSSSI